MTDKYVEIPELTELRREVERQWRLVMPVTPRWKVWLFSLKRRIRYALCRHAWAAKFVDSEYIGEWCYRCQNYRDDGE